MADVGRQLFVPLALAVGFAMISSYLLSSSLVPVLSAWFMKQAAETERHPAAEDPRAGFLPRVLRFRWLVAGAYFAVPGLALFLMLPHLSLEIFPTVDSGEFQLPLRAPTGTRIEPTELAALPAPDLI